MSSNNDIQSPEKINRKRSLDGVNAESDDGK